MKAPDHIVAEPLRIDGIEQFVQGAIVALFGERFDFGSVCAKAGAPHQMRYQFQVSLRLNNHNNASLTAICDCGECRRLAPLESNGFILIANGVYHNLGICQALRRRHPTQA